MIGFHFDHAAEFDRTASGARSQVSAMLHEGVATFLFLAILTSSAHGQDAPAAGPQGTLLGRNSIGGAIHVITRDPGGRPGARLAAEMGSRDRLNLSFHFRDSLSERVQVSAGGSSRRAMP